MALLELDHVTKRFGRVVIAEDLSFSVGAGDTVGIVGPNGAGKTSLFGLISGDLSPGAGLGQPNANISNYTLFEIAYAALTQVNDPHNKQEVADALFKVKLAEAVAGPVDYTSTNAKTNPAPGVAITPPVGIQWQKGTKYALEAKVVDNTLQPLAKITGDLLPTFK